MAAIWALRPGRTPCLKAYRLSAAEENGSIRPARTAGAASMIMQQVTAASMDRAIRPRETTRRESTKFRNLRISWSSDVPRRFAEISPRG